MAREVEAEAARLKRAAQLVNQHAANRIPE